MTGWFSNRVDVIKAALGFGADENIKTTIGEVLGNAESTSESIDIMGKLTSIEEQMINTQDFLENKFEEEFVWTGGVLDGDSELLDISNYPHISIMGRIDDNTEIRFYTSHNGTDWFLCSSITSLIQPTLPPDIINVAEDGANFNSNPAVNVGSNANLAEESGFANWNKGGNDITDLYIWYDFGAGFEQRVVALEMYCQMSGRAPLQFIVDGSNNTTNGIDGTWVELFTQDTDLSWISNNRKDFDFIADNIASFRVIRIRPTKVSDANNTRINEIKLLASVGGEDIAVFPKTVHKWFTIGGGRIKLSSTRPVTGKFALCANK